MKDKIRVKLDPVIAMLSALALFIIPLLHKGEDPNHPDHEQMLEWVSGHFDPNVFDFDEVNEQLSAIR